MCLYSKCSGFYGHSRWAPKKAGSVQPLLILWPYRSFPTLGTNGDKCRLPDLTAQPWPEVAVGVGQKLSPGHNTVRPNTRFAKDLPAL